MGRRVYRHGVSVRVGHMSNGVEYTIVGKNVVLAPGKQRWGPGYWRTFWYSWGWPWGRVQLRRQARQVLVGGKWMKDTKYVKCTSLYFNLVGALRTVTIGYTHGTLACPFSTKFGAKHVYKRW